MRGLRAALLTFGRRTVTVFVFMLALGLLTLPLALLPWMVARMLLTFLLWLGGTVVALARFEERIDGWAVLLVLGSMMSIAGTLRDYIGLRSAPVVRGISAAAIPQYPAARAFELTDVVPQLDYRTRLVVKHRQPKTGLVSVDTYEIAPLTSADWTPDQPVPAWVGCPLPENECTQNTWNPTYRGAVLLPDAIDLGGLAQARDQALAEYGLAAEARAPILALVPSVEAAIAHKGTLLFGISAMLYVVWFFSRLGYDLVRLILRLG